jgi:hypothetical protein
VVRPYKDLRSLFESWERLGDRVTVDEIVADVRADRDFH